ncbi:MAG: VOC family protein [Alphaproteobacteria bacterium]
MAEDLLLKLDHVGIAAGDLDTATATYDRLGFHLTPAVPAAATEPGAPSGWASRYAMLVSGYLELMGVTDAALDSPVKAMLARYQGAHIVAFAVSDATRAFAVLDARTTGMKGVRDLERAAARTPGERPGGQPERARFRTTHTAADAFPEARFVFVEHLTPAVLRPPHLIDHPNGALRLAEIAICAGDFIESRMRIAALLGADPHAEDADTAVWHLAQGGLRLLSEAGLRRWTPGVQPPHLPCVAGLTIEVAHLHKTRDLLEARGIAFAESLAEGDDGESTPVALRIDPQETHGVVILFTQVEDRTHPQAPLVGPE